MSAPDQAAEPLRFQYRSLPQRVRFGSGKGRRHLRTEMELSSARRPMVIVTPSAFDNARRLLEGVTVAAWFNDIAQHVPTEVAERARESARRHQVDLLVAVGGGSAIGLAKAVALTSDLPILALPTTYSGSEATNVWGMTKRGSKITGSDDRVLPRTVVYDAELMLSMPVGLSVVSGLNALAHAIDSLWAPRANPASTGLATEGIRLLAEGLPAVVRQAQDVWVRERVLAGAYLAASAFAGAGSGLHHKMCHVLGGRFDLPHAPMHAVVLPYVVAFNAPMVPEAESRLAQALGSDSAVPGLTRLYQAVDPPQSLRELGLTEQDLPEATDLVLEQIPRYMPRPLGREDLAQLLRAAWAGAVPPHPT